MDRSKWNSRVSSRRHITLEAAHELERLYESGLKPAQILEQLRNSQFADQFEEDKGRKKLERIVDEDLASRPDQSGRWMFSSATDPFAARLVLDVAAYAQEQSENRIRGVTNAEATWIVKLRQAYPEMPLDEVWRLTKRYMAHQLRDESTDYLDEYVAFRGWTGEGEDRYYAVKLKVPHGGIRSE